MKITQIVTYTPHPNNPLAAYQIITGAERILGLIPNTVLRVGNAVPSNRAVAVSNGKVVKMTTWPNEACKANYFEHPRLREWCAYVLKGWMLEGSTATDPAGEFIDHILTGADRTRAWVRNLAVPESEVMWEIGRAHV